MKQYYFRKCRVPLGVIHSTHKPQKRVVTNFHFTKQNVFVFYKKIGVIFCKPIHIYNNIIYIYQKN